MGFFDKWAPNKPAPGLDPSLLDRRREAAYRALGTVSAQVVSRLVPGRVPWPSSALGKMRIVRRERDVLLVTEGLSDPYDPALHARPPECPLDFELCLAVAAAAPESATDDALARSLWPQLLYALADTLVEHWVDVRGMLGKFHAITCQAPIGVGFGQGLEVGGLVGYLLGMPLDGTDFDRQIYVNDFYAGLPVPYANAAVGILPVKVLRPSELAWAVAQGNEGGVLLARAFLSRGEGCRNELSMPALR